MHGTSPTPRRSPLRWVWRIAVYGALLYLAVWILTGHTDLHAWAYNGGARGRFFEALYAPMGPLMAFLLSR